MTSITRYRRPRLDPVVPTQDGAAVSLGATSTHDAFPGVCRLATGAQDLLCVYREGTDHGVSVFDGKLRKRTSTDNGATWSSRTTIWDPAPDSAGSCCIRKLANDDILVVTWKKLNGVSDWVPYSLLSTDDGVTWGSAVAITTSFTDFALCESVVQLPNGDLIAGLYGQDSGDTYESVRASRSTDGGASWSHLADIAEGSTYGRHLQEPYLAVLGDGRLLCMVRMDHATLDHYDEIHYTHSVDSGATWAPLKPAMGGTGRPSVFQRPSDGLLVSMFRSWLPTGEWRFRASNDGGRFWSVGIGDFTGGSTVKGVYGQWVELNTGQLGCVFSLEADLNNADMWFSKITGGS